MLAGGSQREMAETRHGRSSILIGMSFGFSKVNAFLKNKKGHSTNTNCSVWTNIVHAPLPFRTNGRAPHGI
jgi:hypothetical protein